MTNLESKRRQYDLVDVARQHGFVDVEIIDDDLGRSASGTVARPGFDRLVAWLCAGKVGRSEPFGRVLLVGARQQIPNRQAHPGALVDKRYVAGFSFGFHDVLSGMVLGAGKYAEGDMQFEGVYHYMLVPARGGVA
jgi:hypothetical protein